MKSETLEFLSNLKKAVLSCRDDKTGMVYLPKEAFAGIEDAMKDVEYHVEKPNIQVQAQIDQLELQIKILEAYKIGKTIQVYDKDIGAWKDCPNGVVSFNFSFHEFKIKDDDISEEQNFEYPMCFKAHVSGLVVQFTGLHRGVVVIGTNQYYVGYVGLDWLPHTDTSHWQRVKCPNMD